MLVRMVGNRFTHSTWMKRSSRLLCQFSKSPRDGQCVKNETIFETRKLPKQLKRVTMKYWTLSGVVVPWLHSGASQASDVVDSSGMEAETFDVGAVLLGDVAILIMAPLVIYAALKMIWEEQFEDPVKEDLTDPVHEEQDPILPSDLRSKLEDPVLQDLAMKATKRITHAVQEACDSCLFDADFHGLVVKSEGNDANQKWIHDMLAKQQSISKSEIEQLNSELVQQTGELTDEQICSLMSRKIAEKVAVKELQKMIEELTKRKCS